MKIKQIKFPVTEKSLLNQIERLDKEVDPHFLELRVRKKIVNNPLIKNNLTFLQTYNKLFQKVPNQGSSGDADSLFKKSLRNYSNPLDIIRDLHLEDNTNLKKKKQRSHLTQHHCKDNKDLHYNKEDFKAEPLVEEESDKSTFELFEQNLSLRNLESESSVEEKEFFSPLPETNFLQVEQQSVEAEQKSEELDLGSAREAIESIYRMAEEFLGEDMEAEIPLETEEDEEEGDDELKDVEQMIQQASEELQKVAEENQQMMEALDLQKEEGVFQVTEPEEAEETGVAAGDGSVFKFDPAIDSVVLKELEEAEKQAKATAQVITELKNRVGELLQKEKMTEVEAKELEEKNKALKAQMILFEEKTKRIQFLLAQSNLFEKMQPMGPPVWDEKHKEDVLPKMLVCGTPDAFMPKIVLCQDRSQRMHRQRSPSKEVPRCSKSMAHKLNASYNLQERLVNENVNLEGTRYKLQSDLINKDQTVDYLQKQLCCLQNELRMVAQENAMLSERLQACPNPACPKNSRPNSPSRNQKASCGPGHGLCPADVENRLQEYSDATNQLEKQLLDVEQEVKNIQQELLDVQKEREHLEHHRKMLALQPPCPGLMPCAPFPCMPSPCGHPPLPCCPPEASGEDQQYKELKEKYHRLQEDFKTKLTEVAGLRADNEKLKEMAEKAEEDRSKLELKVKELEKRLKELRGDGDKGVGSKEQLIDLQQQLKVHKELYRQAQDELEELRALVEDIQGQLNDYRNKYLEAIQTVEEQRRQIDIMRLENNRISEQVNLEIVRVKNQFQEKLQELAPLPDILKTTQLKLQEAQQMHLLAERNNESMARELQTYKDKLQAIMDEMALADSDKAAGAGEKETLAQRIKVLEQMLQESKDENEELHMENDRIKEIADENERIVNEKLHEIVQLETQLEVVRDESARQVARIKDRCEIVRKSTQNQVNDLERQLAQTKASARAAEKDRDEIRQKMQAQIRNLNENFEDAQMRIRNLQGHVNFLKNSYCGPTELKQGDEKVPTAKLDPCSCAADY
ncbi:hypothetical protein ABEB36_001745 [Hypothenemus hampei]|uniref:Uncharacterized protein n=1 Tax=Hypothenemus hampei TaxID=57062 RepID=A0ABD1FI60_HYPHA